MIPGMGQEDFELARVNEDHWIRVREILRKRNPAADEPGYYRINDKALGANYIRVVEIAQTREEPAPAEVEDWGGFQRINAFLWRIFRKVLVMQ